MQNYFIRHNFIFFKVEKLQTSDFHRDDIINGYQLVKEIGKGLQSVIWLAKEQITQSEVAMKFLTKNFYEINTGAKKRLEKEIEVMKNISFPLIVQYLDFFEIESWFCIVMEYVSGQQLLQYSNSKGSLPESEARVYFYQLISTIEVLHDTYSVIHRDVKTENILIDQNNHIRLIDFGLCDNFASQSQEFRFVCGSPAYISPEMAKNEPYNKSIDIWAAGVVLFAITHGRLPFTAPNPADQLKRIVFTEPPYSSTISTDLRDLLKKILCKQHSSRISLHDIKTHPWFRTYDFKKFDLYLNQFCFGKRKYNPVLLKQFTSISQSQVESDLNNKNFTKEVIAYLILLQHQYTNEIPKLPIVDELAMTMKPIVSTKSTKTQNLSKSLKPKQIKLMSTSPKKSKSKNPSK